MSDKRVRSLNRLTDLKIRKLKTPGLYEDGGGLRLVVSPTLKKRWVLRVTINGKRRERGLGGYPTVPLEQARISASKIRSAAKAGQDLAKQWRQRNKGAGVTFQEAFDTFFDIKKKSLSNGKHVKQWASTMETYVFPFIGHRAVSEIEPSEIIKILLPIWFVKPETARRVLQRIEAVFKSAILRGHRRLASPCIGVSQELGPRQNAKIILPHFPGSKCLSS